MTIPTSWSSILLLSAIALAIAGADLLTIVVLCGVALVFEVVFDFTGALARGER
jgi:hypothetical protein